MQEFADKIQNGLIGLDWDAKRKIICAIVKQIEVDEEEVHIVYRVGPNSFSQDLKQESLQYCSRRIVPAENELLHHLGNPLDSESAIDNRVLVFVPIGDALKILFKQKLEDIDSARLVHRLRDRGELKG